MILPLQLRPHQCTDAAPSGWFLPGDSVVRWLEELARCGLAEAGTRLFVVPRSVEDRAPAGLLVVPARLDSLSHQPAGIACRLIAERLFVPADAILHPPVTDAEVRALCLWPVSFLHPVFGLSGFDEDGSCRVWNLLELPEERPGGWNSAQAGAAGTPELSAVLLARPPSIDDVFGGAAEEIASEPIIDLPPTADEPKEDALAKSRRNLRRLLARGVAGATRQIPHTGAQRTWLNDLEDWANHQLRGVREQLERIRNKELHRLLRLLETDPDAGLRHAIPMNGFAHRGLAPPGGRLGPRPPNFDLNALGGRAADFWNVPMELQEVLRRRYREMADRELQLGRYRRAAYIYAQLLGDLVSAANALKQGRHYREAALLYEEHLQNPLEAARCLAEGGLLAEAIERYIKLECWLEVADLHERMGNQVAAEEAIRRVVSERVAQEDLLGAARLLQERLRATDEALELLLGAWPSSRQAAGCVSEALQMLARLGRHEMALDLIARFKRDIPPPLVLPLLTALSGPARDYPFEPVRHRAADFSRVLIGRQLGQSALPAEEAGRLTEFLVRLAPHDRLLARDANRHLSGRRDAELRGRRLTPPPIPGNKPVVLRRFQLPRQIEWLRLRNDWQWFYAVGVTPVRLVLVRGVWEGGLQTLSWDCPPEAARNSLVFECTGERGSSVILTTLGAPMLTRRSFPATDIFFGQECTVGSPPWVSWQHGPVAFGEGLVWTAHVAGGRGILSCRHKSGQLLRTIDVTAELLDGAERNDTTRLCLATIENRAAIALGNRLLLTSTEGRLLRFELPGQVVRIFATLPHTRPGLAVMLEHGAVMHWIGAPGLIELERDIASPMGTFVPGGPLVLISDARLVLLEVDARGVQKVKRVALTGHRPIGVSATASPGQFAVLGANGEMTVYQSQ